MPPRFSKVLIPQPRTKFLRIRCPDCGNEQVVFSHASMVVRCLVCGRVLVQPTGGRSQILGNIVRSLD
ncbi:MAG: 30S ribosomal protein S27e [Thermoproteus sp.]|jgi:small subunit ribosomal protein S27e|uniref:30S ribosomal protein S27e n=1 Tax=Thermoproteus sp. CP80 TaxID=1650659 RepID=UPI00074AC4BA|nr:30S ribosomal protein S27e [Thermoproteus sp. CP80]KUO83613.1 MAG: 30S ribosomal protein S27 [Thermoproteus sp. CIS_19]KUO87134.1 MAG: 30S ribosomal protein S27 [Thermoproteus sp. JCHS_4]MCI4465693.1 30S ribosomal protein S27e [Thermoproteus sp.]PLC63055.1 30S ribosomal protein S27e [Thermoproteus sp. CP80]